MKKETVEEGFDRIFDSIDYIEFDFTSFVEGVKWNQEKSYSDVEVLELLQDFANDLSDNVINIKFWFNKFKKK